MNKLRLVVRIFLAGFATGLMASASAQQSDRHDIFNASPAERAASERMGKIVIEAQKTLKRARYLLLAGQYEKAEDTADLALTQLNYINSNFSRVVHDFLAELHVAQGRYALALGEVAKGSKEARTVRSLTTEVIALAGVGRTSEAVPLLERALQGDNVVVFLQGGSEDLPTSKDRSFGALAATAYLLRGITYNLNAEFDKGNQQDLEAAQRLVPRNPMIALNLAHFYRETLKRPDLARKALDRAVGGAKATRDLVATERAEVNALAAKIAAVKASQAP